MRAHVCVCVCVCTVSSGGRKDELCVRGKATGNRDQPLTDHPRGGGIGRKPERKLPTAWFGGRTEGARGHVSHGKGLRVAGSEVQAVRKEPCKELLVMETVPPR